MDRLRSMYAFAIWGDVRKSLLLSRDPFGIKPLYCADDGKTLRFASQVKALLAGGAVDTGPQPAGPAGFLWGYVPGPYTLFQGIRALPAGSTWRQDRQRNPKARNFGAISAKLEQAYETGKQAGLGREAVQAELGTGRVVISTGEWLGQGQCRKASAGAGRRHWTSMVYRDQGLCP
jgi:asparagine synthase (glutamine-hydrolysing)